MKRLTIVLFTTMALLGACSKDDDKAADNSSRTLRYEVTGNFAGSFYASYTTSSGGTVNDQVTSLPWNKEITFQKNVTAANIAISGNGGTVGQQAVLVVKRGGNQVSSTTATADGSGSFTVAAPVVTF